jgi:membrane protease YdiL (CAAX protease family)
MKNSPRNKVVAFVVLTFALSAPFYFLIISSGSVNHGSDLYVAGIMWCPGMAALLTRLIFQRNLRGIGGGWGKTRYQAVAYAIPLGACLAVYGFAWATGIGGVSFARLAGGGDLFEILKSVSAPIAIAITATLSVLEMCLFTAGEELGWRGLLVPELTKSLGYTGAALITGILWALYHYPLLLFSDYHSAAPLWYVTPIFTVGIIAGSFIFSWFRLKSGSVWTAVIAHASHNVFTNLFNQATVSGRWTEYVTTEFGAGLAIVYVLVAVWCWKRRMSLPV